MAYDEGLAERLRDVLAAVPEVRERKMFGGLAFMVRGHMSVGIIDDDLMARVGPDAHADVLTEPHVRPMDFTGRPMKGYVYVAAEGVAEDADLAAWVDRCLGFTSTLPPK